ncbi:SMP-30/gluconolactonase/LRE family protein [Rhodohalobacter sp. 8-1]|uniref:SMP-30/gluconolactonase/LRE family protein n=1 Tax=Rhodohalobacter sp. 8-1 TaxID=3131972 RepID=UPI0030EDC8CD
MRLLYISILILMVISFSSGCQSDSETQTEDQTDLTSGSVLIEGEEPEIIAGPLEFTEGPYWHPDGYLLFSDIPANRVYRWSEMEGLDVYLEPSGNSNGIEADVDGSILLAQHAGRVSRLTNDGDLEVIVDSYNGQRLNSPNDLAVHSNGTIYFTDPPFGVSDEDRELDFSGVYMISPDGELSVLYDEFEYPNGIDFSADESTLYVSDSGTGTIMAFDVDESGIASSPQEFANVGAMGTGAGAADGLETDQAGNVYTTGPQGVIIFDENGNQLHLIEFDEQITNVGWGGEDASDLYITGSDHVFRYTMNATGSKKR